MTAYVSPMADPTDITGRRIGAWLIDLIIYLVVIFALGQTIGGARVTSYETSTRGAADSYCSGIKEAGSGTCFVTGSGEQFNAFVIRDAWRSVLLWGLHLLAYIVIQGLAGGSLGKLAVGLRVVDERGTQAGLGRSAVRTVLWVVDAITFGFPVVGGIMILTTKGHRRVGDLAAGTYVVPKEQMGRPPTSGAAGGAVGSGWGAPPAPGASGGWPTPAPPSPGGTWSPPGAASTSTSPAPSVTAPASDGDGPTWDQARSAYIQYDRSQGAWMQWSDTHQSWGPIDQ